MNSHLHRGLAAELTANEVGVVAGVDVEVRQRLVHVHVDVEAVEEDRRVLVRHQVPNEAVLREEALFGQLGVRLVGGDDLLDALLIVERVKDFI